MYVHDHWPLHLYLGLVKLVPIFASDTFGSLLDLWHRGSFLLILYVALSLSPLPFPVPDLLTGTPPGPRKHQLLATPSTERL
jgi:hypothetical protein